MEDLLGVVAITGATVTVAPGITWTLLGTQAANSTIMIYDPSSYVNWCVWYYPSPVVLDVNSDLSYPLSMIPEIMAYQVAVEIRRKQNIDFTSKEERRNELLSTMKKQLIRDEAKSETVKNVFGQGFAPYI